MQYEINFLCALLVSYERRRVLLQWLLNEVDHEGIDGILESRLGSDVELILPRIIGWMYKLLEATSVAGNPSVGTEPHFFEYMDEQLALMYMILTSHSSRKFVHDFVHLDGLRALLTILKVDVKPHHYGLSILHRCMIYRVILLIVQSGQEYKVHVSNLNGEVIMVCGAIASIDSVSTTFANLQSPVWTTCRSTLLEQVVGNRTCNGATMGVINFMVDHEIDVVRIAGAQILRDLVSQTSFFHDNYFTHEKQKDILSISDQLLHSSSLHLQHEGLELLQCLLRITTARRSACASLATWVHDAAVGFDSVESTYSTVNYTREFDMYVQMSSAFVQAAQAIMTLAHSIPRILPQLVQTHEILIPISFVFIDEQPQSLKWHAALTALHFVFVRLRATAISHLSQLFLLSTDHFSMLPRDASSNDLAEVLDCGDLQRQLVRMHFFRNGWSRPMPTTQRGAQREDDRDLVRIEQDVHAAVHPVIPALIDPHLETGDDDKMSRDIDYATENIFRLNLERHFGRFRNIQNSSG